MKSNGFEHKAKEMYRGLGWVTFFTKIRFWTGSFVQLETMIPKSGKILDLGCGYGIFSNYLALCSSKRKIIGVDTDFLKLKFADRGISNASFSVGDATKMKLNDLNCIILHDVLHHLDSFEQQKKLIGDCKNMLSKKGMLLIVEVDKSPLWKLALGRMTDFMLYKGQPVYYLYKKEITRLLSEYFGKNKVSSERLLSNPFPQVAYICKK